MKIINRILPFTILFALISCSGDGSNNATGAASSGESAIEESFESVAPVIESIEGMIPVVLKTKSKNSRKAAKDAPVYGPDWDSTELEDIPGGDTDLVPIRDWILTRLNREVEGSPLSRIDYLFKQFCVAGVISSDSELDDSGYPANTAEPVGITLTEAIVTDISNTCNYDMTAQLGQTVYYSVQDTNTCTKFDANGQMVKKVACKEPSDPQYEKIITLQVPDVPTKKIGRVPVQDSLRFFLKKTATEVHFAVADQPVIAHKALDGAGSNFRLMAYQNQTTKITKFEFIAAEEFPGKKAAAKANFADDPRIVAYRLYYDQNANKGYIVADDSYDQGEDDDMPAGIHRFIMSGRPNSSDNKTAISSIFKTAPEDLTPKLREACVTVASGIIAEGDDGSLCSESQTEIPGVSASTAQYMGDDILESFQLGNCLQIDPSLSAVDFDGSNIHTTPWCRVHSDTEGPTVVGEGGFEPSVDLPNIADNVLEIRMSEPILASSVDVSDLTFGQQSCATISRAEINLETPDIVKFWVNTSECADREHFGISFDPASVTDTSANAGTGNIKLASIEVRFDGPHVVSFEPSSSGDDDDDGDGDGSYTYMRYVPNDIYIQMSQPIQGVSVEAQDLHVYSDSDDDDDQECAVVTDGHVDNLDAAGNVIHHPPGAHVARGDDDDGHVVHFEIDRSNCGHGEDVYLNFDPDNVTNVNGEPGTGWDLEWNIYVDVEGPTIVDWDPPIDGDNDGLSSVPNFVSVLMSEEIASGSIDVTDLVVSDPCVSVTAAGLQSENSQVIQFELAEQGCADLSSVTLTFNPASVTDYFEDLGGEPVGNPGTGEPLVWTITFPDRVGPTFVEYSYEQFESPTGVRRAPLYELINPATLTVYMSESIEEQSIATSDLSVGVGPVPNKSLAMAKKALSLGGTCATISSAELTGVVSGSSSSSTSGGQSNEITFTFDTSACADGQTFQATFAPSSVTDLAGNDGTGDSIVWNVSIDKAGPTSSGNESGSAVPSTFVISFSEPINPESVSNEDVEISGSCTPVVSGFVISKDAMQITFNIAEGDCGPYDDNVTLTFDAVNIVDANGNPGTGVTTYTASYDASPDLTGPIYVSAIPSPPHNGFLPDLDITMSEAIDPDSVSSGDIVIQSSAPVRAACATVDEVTVNGSVINVEFDFAFTGCDTEYTVTFNPASVTDFSHNSGTGPAQVWNADFGTMNAISDRFAKIIDVLR